MTFLPTSILKRPLRLRHRGGIADQVHIFSKSEVDAVDAALAAGRPLLVRGEPGTGKSQLARAAAQALGRAYIPYVVDSLSESRDLLWQVDALARLGEAQLAGALRDEDPAKIREKLAIRRFLRPGPLWWAFDWTDAAEQAEKSGTPAPLRVGAKQVKKGCVVLIDEIDKAEAEVPNGLLEALGAGEFSPSGRDKEPVLAKEPLPLVIITTNEERALPDAFMRRCLVLPLRLPDEKDGALKRHLEARGKAHFSQATKDVLSKAADLLIRDRKKASDLQLRPLPGQAEYLDLVRAVLGRHKDDPAEQMRALDDISRYFLAKHDS